MTLKSIHLNIPDTKPFDRDDWFEAFVGNFVIPILDTGLIDSYWFTRYIDPKKNTRFRIKTKDYSLVKPHVDDLISKFGFTDLADEEEYEGAEFRDHRFVGKKVRNIALSTRQEIIWDFLHASSHLYVDTFSHCDADGYWYREINHARCFNINGDTLESIHHLFCNLTGFEPRVELLEIVDRQGFRQMKLIAGQIRRAGKIPDELVIASQKVKF